MNNLTTRKIVLGMLMTLVLGFGVPGVVDAVRDPKLKQSSSDFFKFRTPNTTFSISVSLSFDDSATQETVTITPSNGIILTDMFYSDGTAGQEITLTEANSKGETTDDGGAVVNGSRYAISGGAASGNVATSFTIKGRFNNTLGEQTVVITHTTSGGTTWIGNITGQTTYTYYYYVTNSTSTDTATWASGVFTNGYAVGDFGDADIQVSPGELTTILFCTDQAASS